MKMQTILGLMGLFFAAIVLLLLANTYSFLTTSSTTPVYISAGDVSGIAVEHASKLYTMNFQQQERAISLFNRSVGVKKSVGDHLDSEKLNFGKIVIYRIKGKEIVITPLGTAAKQLVFSCPEWNPNGLLRETTPGDLKNLLDQTYDK